MFHRDRPLEVSKEPGIICHDNCVGSIRLKKFQTRDTKSFRCYFQYESFFIWSSGLCWILQSQSALQLIGEISSKSTISIGELAENFESSIVISRTPIEIG